MFCSLPRHRHKPPQVVHLRIPLPIAQVDLLGNAVRPQPQRHDVHLLRVLFHQPAGQGGDAAAAGHHLQHDVGVLDDLVTARVDAGREQEPVVDVQPFGLEWEERTGRSEAIYKFARTLYAGQSRGRGVFTTLKNGDAAGT